MAGSQRVVVHSAIAIVMGGSIAGLWPATASAEPYHCEGFFSHGEGMPEVYRDCPRQPDAGQVTHVLEPPGRIRDHREPDDGRRRGEPWPGRRTRYPPPERAFRLRPPHLHVTDPGHRGGHVDDRPGMIPGRGPLGRSGRAGGAGDAAPRVRPPAATTGAQRRTEGAGRPASRGRPAPRGVPSSVMLRIADRNAAAAAAHRHQVRPGAAAPPARTAAQARTGARAPLATSRRHHPSGARAVAPRRRAAERRDRVSIRDPHVTHNAFGSRTPQPTATTWTVRRISAGDDGLAALRLGVMLVIGLVIAAGTLLLMRITRVIPLVLGDDRSGDRRRPAASYGGRMRALRPAGTGGGPEGRAGTRPEDGSPATGAPEGRPRGRGRRARPRRPGATVRALLRRSPAARDAGTADAPPTGPVLTWGALPAPADRPVAPAAAVPAASPGAGTGVYVRLLGEVVIEGPGGRVDPVTGKDLRDLLGLLAVHRDGLTRERAHELLWPDLGPSGHDRFHGRKRELRRRLARALGDPAREAEPIRQVAHRYLLDPDLVGVDYWELTDALAAAAAADGLRERLAALRRAVDLYAGPFLPGGTRPWRAAVADDLRRSVVQALTTLIEHEHDAARQLDLLRRALDLDPCNEPLRRRQMRLHADLGRVDEAHRSYQALVAALDELGGLRPSPLTTTLYRRLAGREAE